MELLSLILYTLINVTMVLWHLAGRGRFYQFPFWAGMIALGWFFPQAFGGYLHRAQYPEYAYENAMFFAALCSAAIWIGYSLAVSRKLRDPGWLGAAFMRKRLYYVGVGLCLFGFYFQWRLWSLPEEMLSEVRWSGDAVKYHFFANLFRIGFLTIFLLYISQQRLLAPQFLIFIVPCMLFLTEAAVLRGRRADMMDLAAYLAIALWLVRRIEIPKWLIVSGLVLGLVLVNGIGMYRAIMKNKELALTERLAMAAEVDYLDATRDSMGESGKSTHYEFDNYVFISQVIAESGAYDYGGFHWNKLVYNYFPAQVFGREAKTGLMLEGLIKPTPADGAKERYGHMHKPGTTNTGYCDAFVSFGWLGFVKFLLIGGLMGVLYRYALRGFFLGQLLYIYVLSTAMQAITHGTNGILVRVWVYFFALAYPALYWAKIKAKNGSAPVPEDGHDVNGQRISP